MNNYLSYTDSELLLLLSRGDRDAFDILYSRHWADLYKAAFYILKDQEASRDIVQDIFVWLWQHRQDLEIRTLKSYLRAAVKFKVANCIRSGNIRKSFFEELTKLPLTALSPTAEQLSEVKELKAIIEAAISHLPEKCREIFKLNREGQLSNQEIARRLNISIKTVENQMTIALRRIRNAVEPYVVNSFLIILLINTIDN